MSPMHTLNGFADDPEYRRTVAFAGHEAADHDDPAALEEDYQRREAQRADFARAWHRAQRQLNPSPAQQHLDVLAFAAAVLRRSGPAFATEEAQYVALYEARREQVGRALWPRESWPLRAASRELWLIGAALRRAA